MARRLLSPAAMRTVPALIALALTTAAPLVVRADPPHTSAAVASQGGDMAGRFGYVGSARVAPSVTLELRAAAGRDEARLGPVATFYRAQPELQVGFRPVTKLELFAGTGLGPAYVVPDFGARGIAPGPTFSLSGALGARFPWERVPVSVVTRSESVRGLGTAVMLVLALYLSAKR